MDKETEPHFFINNTTHDFVALFFEIWFKNAIEHEDGCYGDPNKRKCKEKCNFCFFEQASKIDVNKENVKVVNTVNEFVDTVIRSVKFDKIGLIEKLEEFQKKNTGRIVLREWYSSAQLKLSALEPFLQAENIKLDITLGIPDCFLFTTWYLAIPVNSPRKDTASEIIIKMTEPPDLAYFQISGIGLQLSRWFYTENIHKSYPKYEYPKVLKAMENLLEENNSDETEPIGIPVSSIHCYFEQLTPLGGMLRDTYRYCSNAIGTAEEEISIDVKGLQKELLKKLVTFSESFKAWQKEKKKRCKSCFMTYRFCQFKKRKKGDKSEPDTEK